MWLGRIHTHGMSCKSNVLTKRKHKKPPKYQRFALQKPAWLCLRSFKDVGFGSENLTSLK